MFGRVEVKVIERWQADSFDVFVFPAGTFKENAVSAPTKMFRQIEPGVWKLEDAGDSLSFTGLPKPSFSVPRDVMEAMISQARKIVPSMANDDAVSDARATRDRLLTVVESNTYEIREVMLQTLSEARRLASGRFGDGSPHT